LSRIGIPFTVCPADVDESMPVSANPAVVAGTLARTKAEAIRLTETDCAIIAADTVVVFAGVLLGKPKDPDEARQMLRGLRDETHQVLTAVVVMPAGRRSALARYPETTVRMRCYSDEEIEGSITRGDPFDKAGGYAIQDESLRPVEVYEGCYCNVVGLSLWTAIELLKRAEVNIPFVSAEQLLPQCAVCPLSPVRQAT